MLASHYCPVTYHTACRVVVLAHRCSIALRDSTGKGGRWSCTGVLIGIILSLLAQPVLATPYSRIVVFGDSISDTGNLFILTREAPFQDTVPVAPPYVEGRFSNGPVWVEDLAQRLSLTVRPFLDGGTNYAFGGAETALNTGELFSSDIAVLIPSIRSQVSNLFFGRPISGFPFGDFPFDIPNPFDDADPRTLYIIEGGPNDLRNAIREGSNDLGVARMAAETVGRAMADLAEGGAVHFLVLNMPDLGQTPESRALGEERSTFATALSVEFNRTLASTLDNLEADFAISISRLNTFDRLRQVVADPEASQLSNVTEACLTVADGMLEDAPFVGGEPCATPDDYLFWDFIHPSRVGHAILADIAFAALPPVVATPGDENPTDTIAVSGSGQNLPVLQVRLGTTSEMVRISAFTLHLSEIAGDATLLRRLRASLIDDTNANGRQDSGEAILATQETQTLTTDVALALTPPLEMAPSTTRHLLVTLDLNRAAPSSSGSTLSARPSQQRLALAALGGCALVLPVLGGVMTLRRQSLGLGVVLVIFALCCSLLLTSCVDSEDLGFDNNAPEQRQVTFTVGLEAHGLPGQTAMSEALAQPPASFTGAKVQLGE